MPWSPKKIVVPIDLADEPSDAVEAAFEITGSRQNVHVIYVVPGMTDYAAGLLLSGVTDEMRVADAEKALQNRLRREVRWSPDDGANWGSRIANCRICRESGSRSDRDLVARTSGSSSSVDWIRSRARSTTCKVPSLGD